MSLTGEYDKRSLLNGILDNAVSFASDLSSLVEYFLGRAGLSTEEFRLEYRAQIKYLISKYKLEEQASSMFNALSQILINKCRQYEKGEFDEMFYSVLSATQYIGDNFSDQLSEGQLTFVGSIPMRNPKYHSALPPFEICEAILSDQSINWIWKD